SHSFHEGLVMSDTESTHETNRNFYDRISSAYDAIADSNEHAARESGQSLLDVHPGERVLEIGFGTGNSLLDFANDVGETGRVCGIDVSQGMLDVANRKIRDTPMAARVDLRLGDAIELDLPDDSFDAVFLSFTLELFSQADIVRVLQELQRVLVPGGRLGNVSMATTLDNEKESFLEKTYQWMHRHFPHIVDCRPIDAPTLIRTAGFDVRCEERLEIWTMPVSVVLATKQA
ncbi:MAG: methyltransferase domain-containing protein, partial [Planctomycetota bacterium]